MLLYDLVLLDDVLFKMIAGRRDGGILNLFKGLFSLPMPQYSIFKRFIFSTFFQLSKVINALTQINLNLNIASTI